MSDNRPTYDTSSSDEEPSNHFHIQLPQRQLNLQEIRKQNHKKHEKPTIAKQTASNLAKAKKITTGSNHKSSHLHLQHMLVQTTTMMTMTMPLFMVISLTITKN